ncbi:MAG: MFS transporter [Coxiellaceae bacterium]|nr:MFS transporter [Coxiellaceae bacterium]
MEATEKTHLRHLMPLYLVIFFGFVGYSLMLTVFTPMLIHSSMAHNTIILGILLSVYPFGQFIGSPVIGALSDIHGRKSVLLFSLLASAIMYGGIALSLTYHNLWWLGVTCFIAGLFESNIAIALSAIADVATGPERTKLFGYINLAASSAYVVGPLVGGKLADPAILNWFDNSVPFWFTGLLLIIVMIYTQANFIETTRAQPEEKPHWLAAFTNLANVFKPSGIRRIYFVNFLLFLAIFGFFRCYPMYIVDEFNLTVNQESNYIAWVAVPILLTNLFLTGWLAKKVAIKSVLLFSGVLLTIMMVVVVLPNNPNWLWLTLFIAGFAVALCMPNASSFLSHHVAANQQGSVMGNNQAVQVASEAISGVFGGLVAAILIPLPLIVLAACALLGVIILLTIKEQQH